MELMETDLHRIIYSGQDLSYGIMMIDDDDDDDDIYGES